MENEHRKSKRTDINVTIQLKRIQNNVITGVSDEEITVNVINISKDGIAFKTPEILAFNGLYDTEITLSNGDKFNSVIKIIRMENRGEKDSEILYGCIFVGINGSDQFKIDVYQILYEFGKI